MHGGDAGRRGENWEVVRCAGRSRLAEERSEWRTSGEGVASGRATITTCILQKQSISKSNFVVRT